MPHVNFTRRSALQETLQARQIDAAWIMQSVDLFYYSGTAQNGHLVVPASGSSQLFIRKYLPRAQAETDISHVYHFRRMDDIRQVLMQEVPSMGDAVSIGIEMDVVPVKMLERLKRSFPTWEWVDISSEIRHQRSVKSSEEIACVQFAADLLDSVFSRIGKWLYAGITELELAAKIEGCLRALGHQGTLPVRALNSSIHYGNVLFGSSGAIRGPFDGPTCGPGLYPAVPKGAGRRELHINEPVFVDLVAGVEGYMCDATRVFVIGQLSEDLMNAHACCLSLQDEAIQLIETNTPCNKIYDQILTSVQDAGYADQFMGPSDDQARFIAHGLGLEIDELPVIAPGVKHPIVSGNVFALEPKLVFPDQGAIGIENTWLFSNGKAQRFTSFPDVVCSVSGKG